MAFDTVRTPFGSGLEVLGGSAIYFSLAASFFTKVRLVAAVGEDFRVDTSRSFARAASTCGGWSAAAGSTFRWEGRYGYDLNNAKTLRTRARCLRLLQAEDSRAVPGPGDASFSPTSTPRSSSRSCARCSRRARRLRHDELLDRGEARGAARRRSAKVDMLLINDGEARQLAGETNLVRAAPRSADGSVHVIVKRGEYGAMVFGRRRSSPRRRYRWKRCMDPTGAGDSFAGGFMGYLAKQAAGADINDRLMRRAIAMGSVMASFTVQSFGVEGLLHLTQGRSRSATRNSERCRTSASEVRGPPGPQRKDGGTRASRPAA